MGYIRFGVMAAAAGLFMCGHASAQQSHQPIGQTSTLSESPEVTAVRAVAFCQGWGAIPAFKLAYLYARLHREDVGGPAMQDTARAILAQGKPLVVMVPPAPNQFTCPSEHVASEEEMLGSAQEPVAIPMARAKGGLDGYAVLKLAEHNGSYIFLTQTCHLRFSNEQGDLSEGECLVPVPVN